MVKNIIFDFGGVLIDWNPLYVYEDLIQDPTEREYFLSEICNQEWNVQQDAGRSLAEATQILVERYPEYEELIRSYYGRWEEMLNGEIAENVEALYRIDKQKFRLFGLTNWSAETFPIAYERYDSLKQFEGTIVSGEEKMIKPDKAIFELLLNRYEILAGESLFIDDNLMNINTAKELGFKVIHISDHTDLTVELERMQII
jgi:2-haloacid dehalogenase